MSVTTTHEQPNTTSTTSNLDSKSREFFLNLPDSDLERYENVFKHEYNFNTIKFSLKDILKLTSPKIMVKHIKPKHLFGLMNIDNGKSPIYGMDLKIYNNELKFMNPINNKTDSVVLDHDHNTGFIRGVLAKKENEFEGVTKNGMEHYGPLFDVTFPRLDEYRNNPPCVRLGIQILHENEVKIKKRKEKTFNNINNIIGDEDRSNILKKFESKYTNQNSLKNRIKFLQEIESFLKTDVDNSIKLNNLIKILNPEDISNLLENLSLSLSA